MNSRWLAYALVLLGLTSLGYACGGGGDSSNFIQVLQTSPTDGVTTAPVETRIGFQIDASIDPATLTNDTFFVTDPDGARVQGALAIGDEPSIAVLTPDEPLSVITKYTATITTGLASTGGDTLEKDFTWRFTTLDSAWGESDWLESIGTGTSSKQEVAIDGQSNALAVWQYTEDVGTSIRASRYTRVDLWGEPTIIDAGNGRATDPRVSADAEGNGFAVWVDSEQGTDTRIWSSRYERGQGWGAPELLQNGEVTRARSPRIAADAEGNAIAVWIQQDLSSADQIVWSNRYVPGSGWGTAEPIDDMPTPSIGLEIAVGVDAAGNAIAMWTRPVGIGNVDVIWSNRYSAGSGWGTTELIKADETTVAEAARLDVGAGGEAFVIWVQYTPPDGRKDVWAARFSGSSWEAPERVDTYDAGDTMQPDIAVDGTGVAHAVWSQSDPDFQNIYARQYTPGSGWGVQAVLIEPANPDPTEDADATIPRVDTNTAGNTFIVWRQNFSDWPSIWSNHIDPGMSWAPANAQLIENEERAAKAPKIVVDENRHAHASWPHGLAGGVDWLRTNRFE